MNFTRSLVGSLFIAVCLIGASTWVSSVQAQGVPGASAAANAVVYPIADLGSCKNKAACKAYCDSPANMSACVAFAEKQGLLKGDDLRISKIVAQKVSAKQTPGGCTSTDTCQAYCNGSVEHLNECLSFGEQLGVIPASDLADAKKIASALQKGATMPGSCKTKADCERYCAVGGHIDECLDFAQSAGMLTADELAQARKVAPFLKSGETPGKCTTKASCDAYCADDSHFTECLGFAEKVGFVSPEDAAMAKKTGGKGPGGCKGQEQCLAYCNDVAHGTECLNYAKEKGLLTQEQQAQIDTGIDQLNAGLSQIPDEARGEVMSCLTQAVGGQDELNRILSKQDTPTQAMGAKFQACFANIAQIMQRVMTAKYQQGGQGGGVGAGAPAGAHGGAGGPPSAAEIMKNIPSSVPANMRAQIEQQIQKQVQGAGGGAPSSAPANVPASVPAGTSSEGSAPATPPLMGGTSGSLPPPARQENAPSDAGQSSSAPDPQICNAFLAAPSCDYVPAGQPHDLCVKCKGR